MFERGYILALIQEAEELPLDYEVRDELRRIRVFGIDSYEDARNLEALSAILHRNFFVKREKEW